MEIDEPNSSLSDQITVKFSINVLQLLKSAQMQHGLRHGDYTRYRRYCTSRLRRLNKVLKFTHGRGKYIRRPITESTVTEVRFLQLVLYMAERAWSHAMEKRQLPDGPNARQRIFLIRRLRKAVKWATLFSRLCASKGDSRTSLEAEAYASYMKGSLIFEREQSWDTALTNFKHARAVYKELGKFGDLENQVLCRERVEELEPSIRYCLHKIGEANLQNSELLYVDEMEGPAFDVFKAKLAAVMSEARSQQVASMSEFFWLGRRYPISNAKVQVFVLKAQELERGVNGSAAESLATEKKLAIYDKMLNAYHEARNHIRNDLVAAADTGNVKDELYGLDKAISATLAECTIERNQLLVSIAKKKDAKPKELVRLYDLLIQITSDLRDLVSSWRERNLEETTYSEVCSVKNMAFRSERCFYLAKTYSLAGKRAEAYALYGRARSLADVAVEKFKHFDNQNQLMINRLQMLSLDCRSSGCIEHAKAVLDEEKASENLSKIISTISLSETERKTEKLLMENLDAYKSAVGDANAKCVARIEVFPPALKSVPRSPVVLDLAYDFVEFPSLLHRMRKDKKGFISRLWR